MFDRTYRSYRVFTRWTLGVLKGVTGASGGAVREAIAKQTQRTGIQLSIETTAHDWPQDWPTRFCVCPYQKTITYDATSTRYHWYHIKM